jgi:hypothetical protein
VLPLICPCLSLYSIQLGLVKTKLQAAPSNTMCVICTRSLQHLVQRATAEPLGSSAESALLLVAGRKLQCEECCWVSRDMHLMRNAPLPPCAFQDVSMHTEDQSGSGAAGSCSKRAANIGCRIGRNLQQLDPKQTLRTTSRYGRHIIRQLVLNAPARGALGF